MPCEDVCDKKCTDNPEEYGDCMSLGDNGYGCQCNTCPVGTLNFN